MKKIKNVAVFLLSFLVLMYAGGVHTGVHYCNSKIISTSINWTLVDCSAADEVVDAKIPVNGISKPSCCLSKYSFSKLSSFQKNIGNAAWVANLNPGIIKIYQPIVSTSVLIVNSFNPPPNKVSLYKRVMRYLI